MRGRKTSTLFGSLKEVGKTKWKDERDFKSDEEAWKYLLDFVRKYESKGFK